MSSMHMIEPGVGHETFPLVQAPVVLFPELAEPVPEAIGAALVALAAVAAVTKVGTGAYCEEAAA